MPTMRIVTEISGSVWKIEKKAGDAVTADESIVILESMKMEIPVASPVDGVIVSIDVAEGEMIEADQLVAVIEGS